MGLPGFAKAFLESGRIGMYARVIVAGEIGAGDRVAVARRHDGAASIRELIRALYFRDAEARRRVLAGNGLDPALRARIEGGTAPADDEG
jgi:MOSC domain-containing protein YiiM